MPRKNTGGRPKKITPAIIQKLEDAFSMGCTDTEACLHAGISQSALYEFQKRNPKFKERKAKLKETPVLRARNKVVSEVEKDTKAAQWYLERKKSDEFGQTKQHKVDITHQMDDQQLLDTFIQLANSFKQQQLPGNTEDIIDAEFEEKG